MSGGGKDSYQLVTECKVNGVIPVYKYKSLNTGLTLVIAQVEGPLVNSYFCLATEAHDDDGLPHTLEHIVFMGSEEYPYKGILDILANRSLASGTNAWTASDHTCYTLKNAGSEGFLNMLPVYLDHILYPTVTESAYLTEVHHINGEGDDAGVVYCEMQGRENVGESRTYLAMLRAMYPGDCGYKSETGGLLENLRTSTSHKKVSDYHRQFYRPENLCIIITGQISPEQVFTALEPVDAKIMKKGDRGPYTRPWQNPVPPLAESVDKVVKYASDDEHYGMVDLSWRGPSGLDLKGMQGVTVLSSYLTDTSISPLQRDFVEIADPYCSQVQMYLFDFKECCILLSFVNVPSEKLGGVKERLTNSLKKIGSGEEVIDMKRMQDVIHRKELEAMNEMEDTPHDTLAYKAISDFLNSETTDELKKRVNTLDTLKELKSQPAEFWSGMINQYMVDKPVVVITGQPSKAFMQEMGASEKARVARQKEELGEEGLKKCTEALKKATAENEKVPPESMLTSLPVPSVDSIKFHPLKTSDNFRGEDNNPKFPLIDMPTSFQLDDIQTNFARMVVTMDTSQIPRSLSLYMPLFLEVLLESPIQRGEVLVPYDEVVRELAADTLGNGFSVGISGSKFECGSISNLVALYLKVEDDKYKRGVEWIRELLYQTRFSTERLRIVANKMINEVAELKRDGPFIVKTLMKGMLFKKESNHYTVSLLRQFNFLSAIVKKLGNQAETDQVIKDLEKLRSLLTVSTNIRVHLAARVDDLKNPTSPWKQDIFPFSMSQTQQTAVFQQQQTEAARPLIKLDSSYLYGQEEGPGSGFVVGMGSVESSFLVQSAPGISNPMDPDLPALLVFIQYMSQYEGPMWRQIRGAGLVYNCNLSCEVNAGLTKLFLFKSTQVHAAYKVAKEIVDGLLSGSTPFPEIEVESGKSSLIFTIIQEEETPSAASTQSMISTYTGTPHNYNRHLIKEIPKVTVEDLRRVGAKYLAPLFDVSSSKCAVVCHPTKVEQVVQGFKGISRTLTVIDSLDDCFLAAV